MSFTKTLDLGFIAVSRGVHNVALEFSPFHKWVLNCINRHSQLDWGDTCSDDSKLNTASVDDGSRVLSVYNVPCDLCRVSDKIWIITEAKQESGKREYTTVLFPFEY